MARSISILECNICKQQFSRVDHRKRHERTHHNVQPFRCEYCERTFSRRDALQRHQRAHDPAAKALASVSRRETWNKSCIACSRSRIRCSGRQPCESCASKELSCTYVPRKSRRAAHVDNHSISVADGNLSSTAEPGRRLPSRHDSSNSSSPSTNDSSTSGAVEDEFNPSSQFEQDRQHPDFGHATITNHQPASMRLRNSLDSVEPPDRPVLVQDARPDELQAINWLPFDQSGSGDLGLQGMDASSMAALMTDIDPTAMSPAFQASINHPGYSPDAAEMEASFSLHNKMAALVTSMTMGIPGLSTATNRGSSAAGRNAISLYSDGAGSRMSGSDRAILARQSDIQVDSELQTSLPSWANALQAKVGHAQDCFSETFSIPDSVLNDCIAQVVPMLHSHSLVGQHILREGLVFETATWRFFIATYFKTFHSTYTFVDQSLLCVPVWGWALCAATAAIGARYIHIPEMVVFSDGLCRALHDLLTQALNFGHVEDSLPYIQARSLAAVGLCHSHDYSMMNSGYNAASLLYNSCMQLRLLEEDSRIGAFQDGHDIEHVWVAWRFRESRRRTGLFIWFLDCTLSMATQVPPRFPARSINLRLPSSNDLWEATCYQQWANLQAIPLGPGLELQTIASEDFSRPTVRDAANSLMSNLSLPKPSTPLGISLLTHMLTRRVWDASWYQYGVGSQSGGKNESPTGPEELPVYLATFSSYTTWRNRTCDSLDVLHWDVLAKSARMEGQEDIATLQLHIARLVILTPVRELLGHINACRRTLVPNYPLLPSELYDSRPTDAHCRHLISIWANKDRYKARLALIHAGSIYWHVRRYSTDSFAQPFAVYLAAVTLWAFAKFWKKPASPQAQLHQEAEHESPSSTFSTASSIDRGVSTNEDREQATETTFEGGNPSLVDGVGGSGAGIPRTAPVWQTDPTFNTGTSPRTTTKRSQYRRRMPSHIQLDRPIDDELVQHFIRLGDGMTMLLEGVDDLCSQSGSEQVLQEGIIILDSLGDIWPIADNYKRTLDAVLQ